MLQWLPQLTRLIQLLRQLHRPAGACGAEKHRSAASAAYEGRGGSVGIRAVPTAAGSKGEMGVLTHP